MFYLILVSLLILILYFKNKKSVVPSLLVSTYGTSLEESLGAKDFSTFLNNLDYKEVSNLKRKVKTYSWDKTDNSFKVNCTSDQYKHIQKVDTELFIIHKTTYN